MEDIEYKQHPVLYVDDDRDNREQFITECGERYRIFSASTIEEADEILNKENICILISDNRMPEGKGLPIHDNCGLSYLARIRKVHPHIMRTLVTSVPEDSRKMPFELLNNAGVEVWLDSWSIPPWETKLRDLLEKHISENIYCPFARGEGQLSSGIVGKSKVMRDVLKKIEKVCDRGFKEPILIVGESGVGKELVARAIHNRRFGKSKPWIPLSIANLSGETAVSALFGHCKGAFTGAIEDKPGAFEAASGGTLLLDDIDYLDPTIQAQLLRVLQEKQVNRIGEGHRAARSVDAQVLCTTNKDIEKLVRKGKFSNDLYNRITWFVIEVPPLRARIEDVWALAGHFLKTFNEKSASEGKVRFITGIEIEAFRTLLLHDWSKGNVRELQEILHAAWINASKDLITLEDLPRKIRLMSERSQEGPSPHGTPWQRIDAEAEKYKHRTRKNAIIRAYIQAQGNRKIAAELLGLNPDPETARIQLHNYLKQTGLFETLDLECKKILAQCWEDADGDLESAAELLNHRLMEISAALSDSEIDGKGFKEIMTKFRLSK